MINDTMYARGAESSVIREIFTYANERKAQIGAENVFDFSLGNPSVPAPDEVRQSIERSLKLRKKAAEIVDSGNVEEITDNDELASVKVLKKDKEDDE